MSTCGTTKTDAAGAHMNSPASRTTRGKDHPTARLSGPGAGKVWHRIQELAGRARRTVSLRYPDRDAGSHSSDSTNAIAWPLVSSRAYQRGPSPNSLAWAGPHASGRMPSWPTSTQAEPATHHTEAINGHYRTRQTHRQRLPQPHQPPTPNAPHRRRPRRLHPHPTLKSP